MLLHAQELESVHKKEELAYPMGLEEPGGRNAKHPMLPELPANLIGLARLTTVSTGNGECYGIFCREDAGSSQLDQESEQPPEECCSSGLPKWLW